LRGDLVTIREDSGFDIRNTGTFEVSFVGNSFIRLINPKGVAQAAVPNAHTDDFTFFKPDLANVLLGTRPAALVETQALQLTVILPVTAPIVKRTLKGGEHFHQGVTTVTATTPTSLTIGSTSGFDLAGAVRPMTSRLFSKGIVSTTLGNTVTLINADNWPTQGSFYAGNLQQFFYYQGRSGNVLQGVTPAPPASLTGNRLVYEERYSYTSITGATLNGVYPDPSGLFGMEIACAGAQTFPNFPGSFLFDPNAKFVTSKNVTSLGQPIEQGQVTTLLQVGDVSTFDSQGSFVLEFGTDRQEGPIRYLAKVGTTGLIVDPSHVYELDHPAGINLRMVRTLGPVVPRQDGTDLAVYTTSTSPARDLLAHYLRIIAAAGVQLNFVIQEPEQQWPVLPNLYTTRPLDTQLVVQL
jgi:hypothetical protein